MDLHAELAALIAKLSFEQLGIAYAVIAGGACLGASRLLNRM